MTRLKAWLVRFGLWLARLGGWTLPPPPPSCALPHLPEDAQVDLVRTIVRDVEERFPQSPGPVKAREVLRVLMNLRPSAKTRDLNLLIELALQ